MTEQELIEERQRGRKRKTSGSYASKYYDPDKAHEYYMKHRKLAAIKNGSSSSSSKKKSSSKKSSSKKSSSTNTKAKTILNQAKEAIDNNIATLRDTVADWEDTQQELIDNAKTSEEKAAIRKRIRAVKREMNKQIRAARALYRQYKSAYSAGNIEKFAADQAAAAQTPAAEGDNNGDDKKE